MMTTADAIVFFMLAFIAVALLVTMFATRERMIGFTGAMFWAMFGGGRLNKEVKYA